MKKILVLALAVSVCLSLVGCTPSAVSQEENYTEQLMTQANSEIGMPNITNFYEKKLAKEIFEKRDDSELICYWYNWSEYKGKFIYVAKTMGYGLPYSTQYTNPEVKDYEVTLPQADPNGLYSATGLAATWVMAIDEESGETYIAYLEPEATITEHKLPRRLVDEDSLVGVDY